MWIMTNKGFFSAVQHTNKPDTLIVRARVKGHLESFIPKALISSVEYSPKADYLYRVEMTRKEFDESLLKATKKIEYPNFKGSVEDDALHDAYEEVWLAMFKLQCLKDAVSKTSGYMGYAYMLTRRTLGKLQAFYAPK